MKNSESTTFEPDVTSTSAPTVPRARRFISKRRIVFIIKFLITFSVMLMLVKRIQVHNIKSSLQTANHIFIALGFLLMFPNVYVQYRKWHYVLSLVKPNVSRKESLYSLLVGFTFGFITPGRLGEFGRAFFIKDCHWLRVIGISFIDKFFSQAIVFFCGAVGFLIILGKQLQFYSLLPIIIFAIITMLLLRYILVHPEVFRGFLYNLNVILPFREKIKILISSFDDFHRQQALKLLGFSALFYLIILSQYYVLLLAFEAIHPFETFQAISSTLLVKSMLPISLGDLGIRESAAIFFLGKVGGSKAAAFNASILVFAINILIPSMVGLVLVLKNRLINWYEPAR